ncbi:MAG TPA: hypothetical protein VH761_14440, partial [Ilumatobacteraceae bacterium]
SFVMWDGAAWSTRSVDELPPHRQGVRLAVQQIRSAASSELALVSADAANDPGTFDEYSVGLIMRSVDADEWHALDVQGHMNSPVAISGWGDRFVIADMSASGRTQWWSFDPRTRVAAPLGDSAGQPRLVAAADDGLYARIEGADPGDESRTSLWYSADGMEWSAVDLPGEALSVCSDGTRAAASWGNPIDDDTDEFGTVSLSDGQPQQLGEPIMTEPYAVVAEWRRVSRCAVSESDAITTHLSYDGILATSTPSVERASKPLPGHSDGRLLSMLGPGTTETWVQDILWDGKEWVAVGHLSDFEISMDAVLWRSANGSTWSRGTVLAGGPGNQIANSVTVSDGELVVGGLDGQHIAIWRVPI